MVVLQRATKRFLRHKKRQKQTCAAVLIQKIWKGYRDKKAYLQVYDPLMQKTIMLSHYFPLINIMMVNLFYRPFSDCKDFFGKWKEMFFDYNVSGGLLGVAGLIL